MRTFKKRTKTQIKRSFSAFLSAIMALMLLSMTVSAQDAANLQLSFDVNPSPPLAINDVATITVSLANYATMTEDLRSITIEIYRSTNIEIVPESHVIKQNPAGKYQGANSTNAKATFLSYMVGAGGFDKSD